MRTTTIEVFSKAPTRIDPSGGTIDIWPLSQLIEGACTFNMALDIYSETSIRLAKKYKVESLDQHKAQEGSFQEVAQQSGSLPLIGIALEAFWNPTLPVIEVQTQARSPAGAGLGGSSALLVSLAGALIELRAAYEPGYKEQWTDTAFIQTLLNLEAKLIGCNPGSQDIWAAYKGGINFLEYRSSETVVNHFLPKAMAPLAERSLFIYTGQSRASGSNNWQIYKNFVEGDASTREKLNQIAQLTQQFYQAFLAEDWERFLKLSIEEWGVRKTLFKDIETPITQKVAELCQESGAGLCRLGGAGGGGVMWCVFDRDVSSLKEELESKLASVEGAYILDAHFSTKGLECQIYG